MGKQNNEREKKYFLFFSFSVSPFSPFLLSFLCELCASAVKLRFLFLRNDTDIGIDLSNVFCYIFSITSKLNPSLILEGLYIGWYLNVPDGYAINP